MNISKADKELIKQADNFLMETHLFYPFCQFASRLITNNIGKSEWLHSDRWSAVYDWLHEQNIENDKLPEGIEVALTEYFETNFIHVKRLEDSKKTIIEYVIYCFDRLLCVEVNEEEKEKAKQIIDSAYDTWVNEPNQVGDACVEEYICECLNRNNIDFREIRQ